MGYFYIIERIGRLAYRLELPVNIRIYDIILITYLEPRTIVAEDLYNRRRLLLSLIIIDGKEE